MSDPTVIGKLALTSTLKFALSTYRKNRFKKLITAISSGDLKLTQREIESDSFISCFIKTSDAIDKATTGEKITFLIHMFYNGINSTLISKCPDLYHEAITIFSDLSYREIIVLGFASQYLPNRFDEGVNEKNDLAIEAIADALKISLDLAYVLLAKLQRTGFIVDSALMGDKRYFIKTELLDEIKSYINLMIDQ